MVALEANKVAPKCSSRRNPPHSPSTLPLAALHTLPLAAAAAAAVAGVLLATAGGGAARGELPRSPSTAVKGHRLPPAKLSSALTSCTLFCGEESSKNLDCTRDRFTVVNHHQIPPLSTSAAVTSLWSPCSSLISNHRWLNWKGCGFFVRESLNVKNMFFLWWEEEREVFHGRANSFIARMHLVQGDRRFSRWKGSVVDSVIGVFLTQNVSDHLSSSAFMSLAAKFPLKSTYPGRDYTKDNTNIFSKELEIILLSPTDTISLHAKRHPIYSQNSVTDHESTVSWQAAEIPGTETINLLGGQTHSSEEEVLSSQESFDCSINESIGGIRSYSGSNSESEDLVIGHRPEEIRRSMFESSFQKEKALFQDLFNHQSSSTLGSRDQQSKDNADHHQNSAFNATNSINGSSSYTQLINSDAQPAHFPPVAFIPQHAQINPDSRISRAEDDMLGDESICSWPTASKFSTAVAANHNLNHISRNLFKLLYDNADLV
ncbi:hypothetical protein NL676_020009 [Syzygium grande]|nr:hypothetical protein NL676_020009 [Syzygium grande]